MSAFPSLSKMADFLLLSFHLWKYRDIQLAELAAPSAPDTFRSKSTGAIAPAIPPLSLPTQLSYAHPPLPSTSPLMASFTMFPQSFAYGFVLVAISLAISFPYLPPISKSWLAISFSLSLLLPLSSGGKGFGTRFAGWVGWSWTSRVERRSMDFASCQVRWPRWVYAEARILACVGDTAAEDD